MIRFVLSLIVMCFVTAVEAGFTAHLKLDCRTDVRSVSADGKTLYYDKGWYDNAESISITDNGTEIVSGTLGGLLWKPSLCGNHSLQLIAKACDGSQVGLESVEFEVDHIEVVTTVANEPTCTEAGCTRGAYCSRCNAVLAISTVIPPGHVEVVTTVAKVATCTEAGRTKGSYCSRCNVVLADSIATPALGHSEVVTTEAKAATCTKSGWTKGAYCGRCNTVLATSTATPALGHSEVVTTEAKAATCTESGWTKGAYCSRCKAVLSVPTNLVASGHVETELSAKEPTCTIAGCKKGTVCERCGMVMTGGEEIPPLGHLPVVTKQSVSPTTIAAGCTEEIRCSRCDAILHPSEEIPPIVYVRDVQARQLWPHKKVGVEFTVTDDVGNITNENAKLVLQCEVGGEIIPAKKIYGDMTIAKGRHHVIWDLEAQGVTIKTSSAKFRVGIAGADDSDTGLYTDALYCVIDLSNGSKATSYPVAYLSGVPSGGWSDEYKTSKLVLRYIAPGTFVMGSPEDEYIYGDNGNKMVVHQQDEILHEVTLTQGFWIGVFEVTQRQYELVMGEKPSYFSNASYYAKRPVECVSYNDLRGSSYIGWSSPPFNLGDWDKFIGRIRKRTGIAHFDLPTEAQWEYACRAGTSSAINSGGVGRCIENSGINKYTKLSDCSAGTAEVGSYGSNDWGLYDMLGNVYEWCYDRYGAYEGSVSDPYGPSSGSYRVQRGGGWRGSILNCRSAARCGLFDRSHKSTYVGFRLCCWAELVREMK